MTFWINGNDNYEADTISRQAAIDIVSRYAEQLNGYIGSPNDSEVYAYARGLILSIERNINDVPSAQPEPKWIPCSERLPEENGLYLVTVNAPIRPVRIYEYAPWEMSEERKYWKNDCDDHSHVFNHFVKAWMPLPERYREEGEK